MLERILSFYGTKAVLLLLLSAVMITSLVSYDQIDPSLNLATSHNPENLLGFFGSSLGDILLQSLGITNILLIYCLINWAYLLIKNKELKFWYGARILCLFLALVFLSAFLNKYHVEEDGILSNWISDTEIGGVLGFIVNKCLSSYVPVKFLYFTTLSLGCIFFAPALGYSISQYKSFLIFCYKVILKIILVIIGSLVRIINFIRGNPRDYSSLEIKKFAPKIKKSITRKTDDISHAGFELPSIDLFNQNKPKSKQIFLSTFVTRRIQVIDSLLSFNFFEIVS